MIKPRVSIIVPIYNVERYLAECISSLTSQTLEGIEIVLVDDGSTDSSGRIADELAETDSRILVIHQANGGLGPARNTGIAHATGEYVGFVDSDDYVLPDMFERLYGTAVREAVDIVVGGHRDVCNGVAVKVKPHPLAGTVASGSEVEDVRVRLYGHGPDDSEVEAFPMAVWIAIYRRCLIANKGLTFREILSEDTFFNIGAYAVADSVAFVGDTGYCYRKEEQTSITNTFTPSKLERFTCFMRELVALADHEPDASCAHRARRTSVDYCRLYVGMVENSSLAPAEKRFQVRRLLSTPEFREYCLAFPTGELPIQQRLFQGCLNRGMAGAALGLCHLRRKFK